MELAGNGQVALEKVKLTYANFQLILMGIFKIASLTFLGVRIAFIMLDIHMPVMDGLTCARLVRQFEKERIYIYLLLLSAI